MSSGGRKHVFVYSVQHTGTWFLIRILRSAYQKNESRQCGDGWFRRHTDRDINTDNIYFADKPINKQFLIKYGERYMEDKNLKGIKLLIAHGHHHRPGGKIFKSLAKYKPGMHICVPIRDPLLSVHSKLWREYRSWDEMLNWEDEQDRIARTEQFADALLDLLKIPQNHIFLFPIDLSYTEEQKNQIGKKMCIFCDIPFNDGVKEYIKNWKPQNETYSKSDKNDIFDIIKEAYRNNDTEQLYKYLNVEMDYLKTRTDLIEKLKEVGYKNLIWW